MKQCKNGKSFRAGGEVNYRKKIYSEKFFIIITLTHIMLSSSCNDTLLSFN